MQSSLLFDWRSVSGRLCHCFAWRLKVSTHFTSLASQLQRASVGREN
jgi:hypothetical protein